MEEFREEGHPRKIEINWRPYFINPATNEEGEEFNAYCKKVFGGEFPATLPGKEEGKAFTNWAMWPNTLQAQRLVHHAGEVGGADMQTKMYDILFRYIYEEGRNCSDEEVLIEIAREVGIEGAEPYLRGKEGKSYVQRAATDATRMGITGVPFWTVYREGKEDEDPVTLSGPSSSKIFKKIIEDLSF
uniref:DSBA-like thioredoxin domain-containing protein n=1 Tax=Hemiselmis tepida TaxID=464990 RepID=A0A7S0VRE6_9CRYP|mmetsp:Transcript_25202/g.63875  ORF Transcript_25202/g.63875 Transcript_25202/m.63875 type:complete len:187 (+) Transcript_25202:283-843(+)